MNQTIDNFNGRSCHFISTLKAALFVMKTQHVNVPRPNSTQDLFTRLFVEIYWNFGSSELDPINPEPIFDAFIAQYMQSDVQLSIDIPTMYQHPKERYYDSRLFLERLAGYYRRGRTTFLRRPRTIMVVPPNELFENFQPIFRTNQRFGDCHNRNYDISTEDRVGVISIIVDDPHDDDTVQSIIQNYFQTEFDIAATKCLDCQKELAGHQSYQISNDPEFIAFFIDRNTDRLPLGGNIIATVNDSEYILRATTMHVGHNLHVSNTFYGHMIIFNQ